MSRLMPSEARSRYKTIIEATLEPLTFSQLYKKGGLSKSQFYGVLVRLEEGSYIKKIEARGEPYYIIWKWGHLTLDSDTMGKLFALDWIYEVEK